MRIRTFLSMLALVLSAGACGPEEGRERGPIRTDDTSNNEDGPDSGRDGDDGNVGSGDSGDSGANNTTNPDGGPPDPDAGMDMTVTGDAGGRDVPTGMTCGYTDIMPFPSECDWVTLAGCPDPTEACLVTVTVAGPTTTLSSICRDSTNNFLKENERCVDGGGECEPGTICVSFYGTCRRLCEAATGKGCETADSCRRPTVDWGAVGFCDIRCPM